MKSNSQHLRDDCLAYAVAAALVVSIVMTSAILYAGLGAITAAGVLLIGVVLTFTVTPHLVAQWLDIRIETLLEL